jgi:hypothetical protein
MTVITIFLPLCVRFTVDLFAKQKTKIKQKKMEKKREKGVAPVCTVVVIPLMPILHCHLAFDLDYYCCIRHC